MDWALIGKLLLICFMVGGMSLVYWLLHPSWLEDEDQ